eukprot:NODE_3_length_80033_cov_0.932970.p38 type:complete len:247 gc:universal NODE_3_length_80033_cov_0.932970:39035-38295(-)
MNLILLIAVMADCAVNTPFCPSTILRQREPEPNSTWQSGNIYEIAWNGQYNTFVTAGSVDIYLRALLQSTNNPIRIFSGILASQERVDYMVPLNTSTGRYEIVIMPKDQQPLSGPDFSIPLVIKQKLTDTITEMPPTPSDPVIEPNINSWKIPVIVSASIVGCLAFIALLFIWHFWNKRRKKVLLRKHDVEQSFHGSSTDMGLIANTFKKELGRPIEDEDFGVLIRSLSSKLEVNKDVPTNATILE